MPSRLELSIDLLHGASEAALATHAVALPGYPLATAAAFILDQRNRPLFLISSLSEHTRNLHADGRVGMMVSRSLGDGEIARISLLGDMEPLEAGALLMSRYLRYHPHAEQFLQFGDFRFCRLHPLRALVVGGFAQAGWLEGERLLQAASFSLAEELQLMQQCAGEGREAGEDVQWLGVDPWGADLRRGGERVRLRFDAAPVAAEDVMSALRQALRQS